MDKKIEQTLTEWGGYEMITPIARAEQVLGFDPVQSIKAGNLEATRKQMNKIASNDDQMQGFAQTGAFLKCVIADYVTRKHLTNQTENDADMLAIEREVLRQMLINEPKPEMVWPQKDFSGWHLQEQK